MKQLKPRDKITQKMTRDGAVEINETQQTAERISSREADSDFSQPDTATAERVMEHLDAAHTRKASKKAVKKAQEAAVLRTSTSRLQFTDEERETPKLQPYIKKSEKAADKLDAAKAALPKQKKLVKERTFEETTGKAKTRLRFTEQEKPINGGKAQSNPLSRPAQEAGIFVHNKIHSVEKDNSGVEGAHKSEELAERGARYGTRKLKQGYRSHKEQTTEQAQPEAEAAAPELPEETAPVQEKETKPEQAAPAAPYYTINEAAAKRAKDANSFSDYKQGSATAEYRHYVDEAVQLAERQKQRVDPMYHEKIDSLLDTYARKLAANMNKGYEIDARVPSILIAGGSNFPTRKKEKQNAARDSNYREWQDIQGLLDKIRSTGMGGISADDPQAVQKLEKKLESLEKSQETMKAVNAYYRKHKTLDGCPHLLPEQLEKLKADMASSWHLGDKPFATWALSNNSAEIRRVKDRIKSLSQQKEIGFVGWEFDGGKVEANTEANRLQIFFEDKPDEATREALKSNGFRWSPKAGAWQRQLTSNAYYAADYIKAIAPLTGEKPTELQRAHIRAQKIAAQEQPVQEQPEQEAPQDKDIFSIYQIKGGDETRDLHFEPYDRLTAAGHRVDAKNYTLVYSAPLTPGTSLEDIYTRFNIDHPKDFKGHSLSVSDVVVLHQNGQDTAHYVDSFGYKEVPEFLQPENYLKAAEQTTEQNYNMIDGQINNTPTAAELEEKAKAGEQISLAEYAEALKTDKGRGKPAKQEKPSIRAQLKAAKEQTPKKQAKQKTQDLERS